MKPPARPHPEPNARMRATRSAEDRTRTGARHEDPQEQVLWRTDGGRYERVGVRLTRDGDLVVRSHRSGGSLRDAWGEDDHEATLTIAREDLGALALVLLKTGFAGQSDALELLRTFCDRRDVPHAFAVWT